MIQLEQISSPIYLLSHGHARFRICDPSWGTFSCLQILAIGLKFSQQTELLLEGSVYLRDLVHASHVLADKVH